MKEKMYFIQFKNSEIKEVADKIEEKNQQIGKRRYSVPGFMKFICKKRFNMDVKQILNSATTEEYNEYLKIHN
ncbi:MAG: hypothetical protein Q8O68_00665 [Candidatus Daviesbacteria bacterium]|nr:hypothetical protein [Candidatus Daviesbacteria bacterium]